MSKNQSNGLMPLIEYKDGQTMNPLNMTNTSNFKVSGQKLNLSTTHNHVKSQDSYRKFDK